MLIVDAHLDLSYNALQGRQVLRPAAEQAPDDEGIPTVGLPDLVAGGVALIGATIFCQPAIAEKPGYRTADEAHAAAEAQLAWYLQQCAAGSMRLVTSRDSLPRERDVVSLPQKAILLLEGADALRCVDDLQEWFDRGLRIVGLAWKRTRYAGGTGEPGPLTADGIELVRALDRVGIIHDLSHLAEESFWQLLEMSDGPVMASHSNCRAIVPGDRQLSDEMIRAIAHRGGVIGMNFFDAFLLPPEQRGKRRATLDDLLQHVRHGCDVVGDAAHVGLGTDMDGGLGREEIPAEIRTSADLPRIAPALEAAGFSTDDVSGILGGNWLRFFDRALP